MRGRAGLGLMAVLWACAVRPPPLITVVRQPAGRELRLLLVPNPGVRINARLKPALERPDRTVLRFDSPALTADSSYFTAPPELMVTGRATGTVRASVCPAGEEVCRMVELQVD